MQATLKTGLVVAVALVLVPARAGLHAQQATPRQPPGAEMTVYTPEQHDLYDGRFILSAGRVYMVWGLDDLPGWNHIDAATVHTVDGTVEVDVNEITNTGQFIARLTIPEGDLVIEIERFNEFNPCQDGVVDAFIYEHRDSGCGDTNWPKTLLYIAGWGFGHATVNGQLLHEDYQVRFMVTQGIRDRETLEVNYPLLNKKSAAGGVNPEAQQLDFFIRSPDTNANNNPTRERFHHFFAMEVTWK